MSYPTVIYGSDGDQFTTGTKDFGIPLGTKMVFSGGDEYRWANVGGVILAVSLLNQAEAQASPFAVDEAPIVYNLPQIGTQQIFLDVPVTKAVLPIAEILIPELVLKQFDYSVLGGAFYLTNFTHVSP